MSDNLDLSASITTEEPEVAANLDELRFLVFQGKKGDTGDSAYEEAVSLGFVGTEAEWIASLKGAKGDTGFSPEIRVTDITGGHKVDVYNELGFESFDVMDGIDGTDGEDGEDGEDGVSPTVTVQNIAGGHSVTITDATHPQGQSFAVMNGSGIPEDVKVALLDCFENVAWINDQGQTYYNALYAALYPPKTLVSISAVFNQGSAVIYDTDSLDTLKQYLTVTATYDDSSTGVVTTYTLSGTLTEGTSTITVLYNGKTTTFNVTVTAIYLYKMSDGDISKITQMTTGGQLNAQMYVVGNVNRRLFALLQGRTTLKQSEDQGATYTDTAYYPIPIPANAVSVTVSITPSTQYFNVTASKLNDNQQYIKTAETGWKSNSYTYSLPEGVDYIAINSKYNNSGSSYPTEPSELVVQFNV